jgi:Cys-rich repeat protein
VFFLAAAEDGCTIHVTAEDDDGECIDLAEYCPALVCEVYATDDDGCQICECAVGEGEGEGECDDDSDCGPGAVCQLFEECGCAGDPNNDREAPAPPDDGTGNGDQACAPECRVVGFCTEPNPIGCENVLCAPGEICLEDDFGNPFCVPSNEGCFIDDDCGEGARCNLDHCNGGCEGAPDGANCLVACQGFCEPAEQFCSSDAECPEGSFCDFNTDPSTGDDGQNDCIPGPDGSCGGARPVPVGVCREEQVACPAVIVICEDGSEGVDLDGDGCPLECPTDQCPALCGPNAECVVFDDGTIGCVPVNAPECTSDEQCDDGETCNAADVCLQNPNCDPTGACTDECWGFCVAPEPQSCLDDADCAAGERCELRTNCLGCADGDPNCDAPCFVEGVCVPADATQP